MPSLGRKIDIPKLPGHHERQVRREVARLERIMGRVRENHAPCVPSTSMDQVRLTILDDRK
jgi:hypothetical protein